MKLDNSIKKRFVKDFNLPIGLLDDNFFYYYLNLYDNIFDTNYKYKLLLDVLEGLNKESFFNYSENLFVTLKEKIVSTNAYKELSNTDFNLNFKSDNLNIRGELYIQNNINKQFISIDLEKANFNCFNAFGLNRELQVKDYDDFLRQNTKYEYFVNSKMIRQVLFGDLEPKKQSNMQKHIICNIYKILKDLNAEFISASNDELVITNNIDTELLDKKLLDILDPKFHFYKIEKFNLKLAQNNSSLYVKEILDKNNNIKKTLFKNIPNYLFAQIYKKYFNLELNDKDFYFSYEGRLAKFIPDNEVNISLKNKI